MPKLFLVSKKTWFFLLLILLLNIFFLELVAFVFLEYFISKQFPYLLYADLDNYVDNIPASLFEKPRSNFDKDLGWDNRAESVSNHLINCAGESWGISFDKNGSRNNPHESTVKLISIYGGSYTMSQEVSDNQTWQYWLSSQTSSKVLNFGVGGHGPDQALLKLKRNISLGLKTPIVVLGLYSGGVHRTVSAYRPYLRPSTEIVLGFKPILLRDSKGYHWTGVPIEADSDRDAVREAAIQVREYDYWYKYNKLKPVLGFPYTITLGDFAYYLFKHHLPARNYWQYNPDATSVVSEVVRQFVQLGHEENFAPVVVFIPSSGEMSEYSNGDSPRYEAFKLWLRDNYSPSDLTVIDVFEEEFDASKFMIRPGCHASIYGNKIIARAVFKGIEPILLSPPFAYSQGIPRGKPDRPAAKSGHSRLLALEPHDAEY